MGNTLTLKEGLRSLILQHGLGTFEAAVVSQLMDRFFSGNDDASRSISNIADAACATREQITGAVAACLESGILRIGEGGTQFSEETTHSLRIIDVIFVVSPVNGLDFGDKPDATMEVPKERKDRAGIGKECVLLPDGETWRGETTVGEGDSQIILTVTRLSDGHQAWRDYYDTSQEAWDAWDEIRAGWRYTPVRTNDTIELAGQWITLLVEHSEDADPENPWKVVASIKDGAHQQQTAKTEEDGWKALEAWINEEFPIKDVADPEDEPAPEAKPKKGRKAKETG